MDRYSFLNAVHSEYIEDLYQRFLTSPDSLEPSWKAFFQGFDFGKETYGTDSSSISAEVPLQIQKEFNVINLIDAYRTRGHLFTKTNPVRERRTYTPRLELKNFDLSSEDLATPFNAGAILGLGTVKLQEIITHLEAIYCDSIGVEYMYIREPETIKWIQNWLNENDNHPKFDIEEKKHILHKLNQAVAFENFLHTKFVGQKRFSLEGGETLIPALDNLVERAVNKHDVSEFVIGMAHRGRLNVLSNIMGKTYEQIFSEFEGKDYEEALFSGDVKYHLGSTTHLKTSFSNKDVKLNLAPNPSHLETVDAVVEGIVRAKVDLDYKGDYGKIVPILIHGDAALAGQGIVYEVIQMMTLDGYKTGGTIHVVINNQIGFTTNYLDARSSTYCTDIAKVTLSPVLHVNADDVEAVVHALNFAVDYRMKYKKDVFIDLLGYRKYGHNEGDEPRFTQPTLYKAISKHDNPREIYKKHLIKENILGESVMKDMEVQFKALLEKDFDQSKSIKKNTIKPFMEDEWKGYKQAKTLEEVNKKVDTTLELSYLKDLGIQLTTLPEDKNLLRKVQRLIQQRQKQITETNTLDWGMAELLAYASLLKEGYNIRLSGEDVQRGTFSHRHAVIKDETTEEKHIALNHLGGEQGIFEAYNSHLSEYGVLGFDYGYAAAAPNTLTIWEAQFGDFSNGAQIMIDQYISAAEDKWKMQNGLVMLLPHGYEGQGAEHSSARLERYLQLCALNNMSIVNCSTPGNFYHLLRRQMKRTFRKPLIVFTPKSLLRHSKCISTLEDLANGSFQSIIPDGKANPEKVEKVVFVSGKFYYDILAKQEELAQEKVALVRVEELYPLPMEAMQREIVKYTNAKDIIWAQEEPENMGAWGHVLRLMRDVPFKVACPRESAAPASGSSLRFLKSHNAVIENIVKF